jgi:hypothetical protein
LLGGCVDDPASLKELDLDAVGRGDRAAVIRVTARARPDRRASRPGLHHGKRDECCALLGRPLVSELAKLAPRPGSGRRTTSAVSGFAPTATIPAGRHHARPLYDRVPPRHVLDAAVVVTSVLDLVCAAGRPGRNAVQGRGDRRTPSHR